MNKQDLRESSNLKELSSIIKGIIHKKSGFTIWQNNDESDKTVIPGVISSQFLSSTELTLEFRITDSKKVNIKKRIFMLSPDSGILIKGKVKIVTQSKLKVTLERKFYLKEKRDISRINLTEKEMYASIQRKIELRDTTKKENVKMKDLSDGGFGFYITSNRAVLFQPNSDIILESLEDVDFGHPITGKITHVTPVEADNSLNNKLLLVGVRFVQQYRDIDTIVQQVEVNLVE